MLSVPVFHGDSQTPTNQVLSSRSRLFLLKRSPSFYFPVHPTLINDISHYMLGLRNRVSKDRALPFISGVSKERQVLRV